MKTLKAEVQHLEEELSELRGEKETLEKVRRSTTLMPDAKITLFLLDCQQSQEEDVEFEAETRGGDGGCEDRP